jgi:hypothetical protein
MKKLKVELWTHDENSVWWPKAITEPDGTLYIPEWDESKIDLEFMQKYVGQEIEIYFQIGMTPKKLSVEKLVAVRKDNGIWGFQTE